jgi:MFS family permease
MNSPEIGKKQIGKTERLIIFVAILGFAFDIYELLMMPLIAGPAISELLKVPISDPAVRKWVGYIFWGSAISGGIFGLLGGYLTDRFGRKRVLTWSILVYSFSPLGAAFSTDIWHLLFFRCTTFIGVCVEFVAAVAWLAELFPNYKQRETVLGVTQAFSSIGGLMVTGASMLAVAYASSLPAIYGEHSPWRYTLISGLIPGIPLMFIQPFLPESPAWQEKRAKGTLKRPSLVELFRPQLRQTTVVTTLLFACAYGAAFGAIQLVPTQIVPGLPDVRELQKPLPELRKKMAGLQAKLKATPPDTAERASIQDEIKKTDKQIKSLGGTGNQVQLWQEIGGLIGRVLLAILAVRILSRRTLLRIFQVPGLIIIPLVFLFPARDNLELLKIGMFMAGLLTVAQFSFWGNYLPRVYPLHLRGTGESFAANIGGRMLGTSAAFITTNLLAPNMPGKSSFEQVAFGAAVMAFSVYAIGLIASFWLPEPPKQNLEDQEPSPTPQTVNVNK